MSLFSHAERFSRTILCFFADVDILFDDAIIFIGNQQGLHRTTTEKMFRTVAEDKTRFDLSKIDLAIKHLKVEIAEIQEDCRMKQKRLAEITKITGGKPSSLRPFVPPCIIRYHFRI